MQRGGLWVIAIATALSTVIFLVEVAMSGGYPLATGGASRELGTFMNIPAELQRIAAWGAGIGCVLCVRGMRERWARVGLVCAGSVALMTFLGRLLIGYVVDDVILVVEIASLFAPVLFALVMIVLRQFTTLAWWVIVLAAFDIGMAIYEPSLFHRTGARGTAGWCYLALAALGAFPVIAEIPHAVVRRSRARAFALVTSMTLCVGGASLLALFGWVAAELQGDLENVGATGLFGLLAGGMGLWRMRRRLSAFGAVAVAIAISIAFSQTVKHTVPQPQRAKFERHDIPGLSTTLPYGRESHRFFQEIGAVEIDADYPGRIRLEWRRPGFDEEVRTLPRRVRRVYGSRAVDRFYTMSRGRRVLADHWQCSDESFLLTAEVHILERDLEHLFDRIQRGTDCRSGAEPLPEFAITLSPPPGYTASEEGWFETPTSTFDHWWNHSRAVEILRTDPVKLVNEVVTDAKLGAIQRLPSPDDRPVVETIFEDKRLLMTAFECPIVHVTAIVFHLGPTSEPREPILAAFAGTRCP